MRVPHKWQHVINLWAAGYPIEYQHSEDDPWRHIITPSWSNIGRYRAIGHKEVVIIKRPQTETSLGIIAQDFDTWMQDRKHIETTPQMAWVKAWEKYAG